MLTVFPAKMCAVPRQHNKPTIKTLGNSDLQFSTEIVSDRDTEARTNALVQKYGDSKVLLVYGGGSGLLTIQKPDGYQTRIKWRCAVSLRTIDIAEISHGAGRFGDSYAMESTISTFFNAVYGAVLVVVMPAAPCSGPCRARMRPCGTAAYQHL